MAWQEKDTMSLRQEFVHLAGQEEANVRELCRRYEISPKTGYKWLAREAEGPTGLLDRSRRPKTSPARSPVPLEQAVVQVRQAHPSWGGRKIARRVHDLGQGEVAPSTVNAILRRHGLIRAEASAASRAWQRFEHEAPNALWQIDFKGDFPTLQGPCAALTLLDDHSRFNLTLTACTRKGRTTVQPVLQEVFHRYGMPVRINADNGAPWGSPSGVHHGLSQLSVWLIRHGIRVSHSRPYHPQTNGKLERFHRTLEREVLAGRTFTDPAAVQRAFDGWRPSYNAERPHDALQMDTPIQRYQPSVLRYPQTLPPIEYADGDFVARVSVRGDIRFQGRLFKTSQALAGLPVAVRPDTAEDGCFNLYFCHQRFMRLDLRYTSPHG